MIFPVVETEDIVQVNDKTRINASKSFVTKDESAITNVEIEPEAGAGFITVFAGGQANWFLDWAYATEGTKVVTVRVTNAGGNEEKTTSVVIISAANDKLWSSDADLVKYESDIMKWVPAGRASWLNKHRKSQLLILDWLDSVRIWADDGSRLTKDSFLVTDDVSLLSVYITLQLIMIDVSNKPDDAFEQKARMYAKLASDLKGRGRIQADFNKNDIADDKGIDNISARLVRR
jgi:hypothetical protein